MQAGGKPFSEMDAMSGFERMFSAGGRYGGTAGIPMALRPLMMEAFVERHKKRRSLPLAACRADAEALRLVEVADESMFEYRKRYGP